MTTTKEINKVLEVLSIWRNDEDEYDGGTWKRYGSLEGETGIKKQRLKEILKDLKNKNIVEYVPTINTDGRINGWGYFLKYRYVDKKIEEIKS